MREKKREKHSATTDTKVKGDPVDKTFTKTAGKKSVEPLPLVQNVPIMQPAARKIVSSSQYHLIKSILQASQSSGQPVFIQIHFQDGDIR